MLITKIHKRFMVIRFQLFICNFSTYLYSYSTYTTYTLPTY